MPKKTTPVSIITVATHCTQITAAFNDLRYLIPSCAMQIVAGMFAAWDGWDLTHQVLLDIVI